jgi:hypothetical protein
VVLDMQLVGDESAATLTEVVASLVARQLARPVLAGSAKNSRKTTAG